MTAPAKHFRDPDLLSAISCRNYIFARWPSWIMGNHNIKGHNLWPTNCMPHILRYDQMPLDGDSATQLSDCSSHSLSVELENFVINNDSASLREYIRRGDIDVNIPLNEKKETALILAVKLSHSECVLALLSHTSCNKNCINVNNCSALDMALITAFDNRLEPRHSVCWEIIQILMSANSEPMCKDAMMYIVRTAFKYGDDHFLYKLIATALSASNSVSFHELLLQKLHRHQPIYVDIIDPILIDVSDFSIKLLKRAPASEMEYVVNTLVYYIESYWHSRKNKIAVFNKLMLYTMAAGWLWTEQQISLILRSCPFFSNWFIKHKRQPPSLAHLSRMTFRQNVNCLMPLAVESLPYPFPESLKRYILLQDVDELFEQRVINLNDIRF